MKKLRQSEIWAFLSLACLPLGLMGANCQREEEALAAKTTCEPNTAQISVWDGFLQNDCGCGGTPGEIIVPPASLTCTFQLGKTVFIHYQGPRLVHQIVPVGSPGIPPSPVYDPGSRSRARIYTHAFTLEATGTYQFKDLFRDEFTGSFVVTP